MPNYIEIPILESARRCGIRLNSRSLQKKEAEAWCPFCPQSSREHLYLNQQSNKWYCQKCGQSGNSVSLYAKVMNLSNKEAFEELSDGNVYSMPMQPVKKENPPKVTAPLSRRHDVYYDMLSLLTLEPHHKSNLLARGLTDERIVENMYRSMPADWRKRQRVADTLANRYELSGIPGFHTKYGEWRLWGTPGILIPVLNKDGFIQGLQIRKDNVTERKYRWLSSNPDSGFENGTAANTWIHVTGDTANTTAYITEGGLKGDVASFLSKNALFICTPGVNAIELLPKALSELHVEHVIGCYDMDMAQNSQVRDALHTMAKEIERTLHIPFTAHKWSAKFNGIDDYLFARERYLSQKAG